ncbi:hypothetical protein ACHAXA_004311 [Cyclostephanos tholiformis]|uniref:Uncharacterized protein n=1 Tax=Cyclostephanos tholiformis TaxID=382380 RepID=A0ABD3SPF8_9STRA
MADEARAMLDALMGADRNAPVEGASGISSHGGGGGGGGPTRRQKRSCYDQDVCPLYCAWSLSSQEEPTWAESVAVNENMGGIDVYDLFTNTKSDIGTNPYRVDDHAREEFASLPEHEKRRLGYEDMLARKLLDLVRQCDRTVVRNKEKLRREVAMAMKQRTDGSGMGNREDLIINVNEEMLEKCASSVSQAILIEEEMSCLLEKLESLEKEENELLIVLAAEAEAEAEEAAKKAAEDAIKEEERQASEPSKKKKKRSKDKEKAAKDAEEVAATADVPPPAKVVDPRLLELEKAKLTTLLELQSLVLQLPPLRDNTDNLLRQLQYLRSDTSTDKVVCEVSGNFMSSRDADERIAAHYAGKQYVGWKLVRDKLKELQKRGFPLPGGGGGGGGGGGHPPLRVGPANGGGGYRGPPPRDERGRYGGGYRDEYRGGYGGGGRDGRGGGGGYGDRGQSGRNERDRWQRDRYDDRRGGRW